ncbi:MAG: ribokinase [Alkalispirochaeta sp.]
MRHWVVGSLNVDLVVDVSRFPAPGETVRGTTFGTYLGGKGGNQCMALARLGCRPRMVGRVGDDQFGTRYRHELDHAGADVSLVHTDTDEPTGTALIEVAPSGDNRIVIVAGANGTMSIDHVKDALSGIQAGDAVLLQLEIPMETVEYVADIARRAGAVVILDPAPADTLSRELLSRVSWLTPNEHEASVITGIDTASDDGLTRAARALAATGVEHVVIKAGARGAWYLSQTDPTPVLVPGFVVEAVDTTAAGDSFNAGLAWALGDGKRGEDAIRTATAVAAISVTGKGAQGAMPTVATVERFLARI